MQRYAQIPPLSIPKIGDFLPHTFIFPRFWREWLLLNDDDDFDNFDEDLDEDTNRNYVDLDLDKAEDFKEGLDAAKAEATDKVVGAVKEAAEKVEEKAEAKVEEFFDDDDDSDGSMDAM